MTPEIQITLNGAPWTVERGMTVEQLVEGRGLPRERVAVERNREIVRRTEWGGVVLEAGDVVEIVHFVGGG